MSAMLQGDRDCSPAANAAVLPRLVALEGGSSAQRVTPAERRARALARLAARDDATRRCIEQRLVEGSCHGGRDVLAALDATALYVVVTSAPGGATDRVLVSCAALEAPGVLCVLQQLVAPGCVPLAMLDLACGRRRVVVHLGDAPGALDAAAVASWFASGLERPVRCELSEVDVAALERALGLVRDGAVAAPRRVLLELACAAEQPADVHRTAQRALLDAARLDMLAVIVA